MLYFIGSLFLGFSKKTKKISKPVICIGNFIVGGSGKTPTAIAIGEIFKEIILENKSQKEFEFSYLSAGYMGGSDDRESFISLRDGEYSANDVGDEPMILNEVAATYVAKNRVIGAQKIEVIDKIKTIILDDGMQNDSLHKDLTIAVVDGKIGFGNGFLFPAGPMRQTLNSGLKKVDFIVVIGDAKEELLDKISSKKIIQAKLVANNLEEFSGQKLIAFCGLAYPQKFFSFLERSNLEVLSTKSFPDHYFYKDLDLNELCLDAENKGAKLVTTKKDWIKFSKNFQKKIGYLDVELEFLDKDFIKKELKRVSAL